MTSIYVLLLTQEKVFLNVFQLKV